MDIDPNQVEFVTEILNESQQRTVVHAIVRFLVSKGVESARVEFGFVVDRDLCGEKQGEDTLVQLGELEQVILRGLDEGTIEWSGTSNFHFFPTGLELELMLCNDSDAHFISSNRALLLELSSAISESGLKVYDSGKLVNLDIGS